MTVKKQTSESDKKFFEFLKKTYGFGKQIKFFPVDFSKPWWVVFFRKPISTLVVILSEVIKSIYEALTPLILAYAISQKDYTVIIYFVIGYVILEILNRMALYVSALAIAQVQGSILMASYKFFLTVDPIYHSTKSSGAIQSKIQSAGREFFGITNTFLFTLLPILASYITVIFTLFRFSSNVGLVAGGSFIIISLLSVLSSSFLAKKIVPFWIEKREKWSAVVVENLTQNNYIRSTFATPEKNNQLEKMVSEALEARLTSNQTYGVLFFLTRMVYIISVALIAYLTLELVKTGTVDISIGIAIVITYLSGSGQILRIGSTASEFTESVANMNDLWDFIRNFGKQTYPVLDGDKIIKKE